METKFENVIVGEYYSFRGTLVDVRYGDGAEYAVYFPYTVGSQLNPRPDVWWIPKKWIPEKYITAKNGDVVKVNGLVVKKVESFDKEKTVFSRELFVVIDPACRSINLMILADDYEKYLDEC